jgi:hypothetical protein
MKGIRIAAAVAALALAATAAEAQKPMRVRGTITGIDGNVLSVKSRDGQDLKLQLSEKLGVSVARAIRFEDIKPGDYVGSATTKRADGALVALEVHYLPPAVPSGFIPWDLQHGSMMTNANVAAIAGTAGKRELILKYKDGEQKILVPEGIPIVRAVPGSRSDLVKGEYIFTVAQVGPDGKINAERIQVSKDGVKPPQ